VKGRSCKCLPDCDQTTYVQVKIETYHQVVQKIGNAVVEKIKLLKSGFGKSGHHHRRQYFGRN
jgi:hypothetical protein